MSAVPFQMAQNDVKNISNPARITAIGGDNATEFSLFMRDMAPGNQWVFPFTYGFMFPVASPSVGHPIQIDASQTPPGSQPTPVASTKIANLVAYDTDVQFSPGIVSSSQISTRQIAFPSLARGPNTYTVNTVKQYSARGIMVYIKVTVGTGTLTVSIFDFDDTINSANANTDITSVALTTASGMVVLRLYPGIAVAANTSNNLCIGQQQQIQALVATSSITFEIDYEYIP